MPCILSEHSYLLQQMNYAYIRNAEGRESTVSLRDLASRRTVEFNEPSDAENILDFNHAPLETSGDMVITEKSYLEVPLSDIPNEPVPVRRSDRIRKPVERLDL